MACISPLKIFNPCKNPTYRDKIWLYVPCGKCSECRKRYQQDWFVRTYFEYLDCKNKGGITLYVTLTYNNNCLPFYEDTPVFSRQDVQKFLKRFRKSMNSAFGSDCVRYFITSEYGGETHRPHYHGFIYIYEPNLRPFDISAIKHLITKAWSYHGGFVSFGRKGNYKIRGVVENATAFSYVSKYVGKDMNFPNDNKDIPSELRPFHLQSQHLGEYMIQKYGLSENSMYAFRMMIDGTFTLESIASKGNGSKYTYAIPQYITKKVLYDYQYKLEKHLVEISEAPYIVQTKVAISEYHLNKFGAEVKKERELHTIEYRLKEFESAFQNIRTQIKSMSVDEQQYILSRSRYTLKNDSISDLLDFLDSTWFSWTDNEKLNMVIYTGIFKDRVVIPNAIYTLSDDSLSLNDAMLYLDDIYSLDVPSVFNQDDISKAYESGLHRFKETITRKLYSSDLKHDRYYIYDDLISLFNAIHFVLGKKREKDLLEKQKIYDNAKLGVADVV